MEARDVKRVKHEISNVEGEETRNRDARFVLAWGGRFLPRDCGKEVGKGDARGEDR